MRPPSLATSLVPRPRFVGWAWFGFILSPPLWGGLAVALVIAGLAWPGWLNLPSGIAYDLLHNLPVLGEREPQVVIVEVDEGSQASLPALLNQLSAQGPSAIAVLDGLRWAPSVTTKGTVPIIWGIPPSPATSPTPSTKPSLPPGSFWGLVLTPMPAHGVNRFQVWATSQGSGLQPTLEATIAQVLKIPVPPGELFRVAFLDTASQIPEVRASQVLAAKLPSGFAQGKLLLVSLGSWREPRLTTPLHGGRRQISQEAFHALALDTLLANRIPRELDAWRTIALLWLFSTLAYALSARLDPPWTMLQVAAWCTVQTALAWFSLAHLGLMWPLAPMVLAQGLALLLAQMGRLARQRKLVRTLLVEASRNPKIQFQSRDTSRKLMDDWQRMGHFLNQFLHLEWSVFLERERNSPWLNMVWLSGLQMDSLRDQRRDLRRDPYAAALKLGGPMEVQRPPFAKPTPGELQFLVPLKTFQGIHGFWVFGIVESEMADRGTERAVRGFADQIAEMIQLRKARLVQPDPWRGTDGDHAEIIRSLLGQVDDLSRGQHLLDTSLNELSTPILILDLFGRVVRVNPAMTTLLSRFMEPGEHIEILPTLARLTRESETSIRSALRRAILQRDQLSFSMTGPHGENLRLKVRPLEASNLETLPREGVETHAPFGLEGLVIEVMERGAGEDLTPRNLAYPSQTLRTALDQMAPTLRRRRVAVELLGDPGSRGYLANPKELSEVLAILLSFLLEDARKDSTLHAKWVTSGGDLALILTSEGHGFPRGEFQSLVERQLSSDLTTVRGLSTASALVDSWGGRIYSTSELGVGTQFTLLLRPFDGS